MGKASKNPPPHDTEMESLLQRMEIARNVLQNDAASIACLGNLLEERLLPGATSVKDVAIEKSVGESFTGGRSTPVYYLDATIVRGNGTTKRRRFVVKLVLMPGSDCSVLRKRQSYQFERRFYDYYSTLVRDSGLAIPKLLASDLDGTKPWSAFCIVMNNLQVHFPIHPDTLSLRQVKCALLWVAKFHALFWNRTRDGNLWDRGAYWTLPTVDGISTAWTATTKYLELKHPEHLSPRTKSLGSRIQSAGNSISRALKARLSRHGTLIHGDYKAANLFFAETLEEPSSAEYTAVVDFQYTGPGLPAEDVAYLLYPDARIDWLDQEAELLTLYYNELISQLMLLCKGGPSTLSFDEFLKYYELSRLDMTRYWLSAKRWSASTAGEAKLVSRLESIMNTIDGGQTLNESRYDEALKRYLS